MCNVMTAAAEYEHEQISVRTRDALAVAIHVDRPYEINPDVAATIVRPHAAGAFPPAASNVSSKRNGTPSFEEGRPGTLSQLPTTSSAPIVGCPVVARSSFGGTKVLANGYAVGRSQ